MDRKETREWPDTLRLLIFDWDGTLMDSETQIVHSIQSAIADLELEARSADACRNIIGLGLQEAVDALYPGRGERFRDIFVARYRHHWFSGIHESELFPGARETLELLKEAGFDLAVATGNEPVGSGRWLRQIEAESRPRLRRRRCGSLRRCTPARPATRPPETGAPCVPARE